MSLSKDTLEKVNALKEGAEIVLAAIMELNELNRAAKSAVMDNPERATRDEQDLLVRIADIVDEARDELG